MKTPRFTLFFLLFFTPLAFGTKAPWSYAVMEGLTGVGLLVFTLAVIRKGESLVEVPGLIPLMVFLGYILFQLTPLPPGLVKLLSPHAFEIYTRTFELTDTQGWMTLSLHPKSTLFAFFRYASYTVFYVLTVQVLKEKETLQAIGLSIAFFGGLLALSSILQLYLTQDMALWFWYTPENSMVMGPYANHNHYAGLMEMIFPLVLALFFFYRPRIGTTSFFRGIIEILNQEKANIHILIGASALIILVSIFVSLSRGAIISTCLSLSVFVTLLMKKKMSRRNSLLAIGLVMAAALAVGWFGWDPVFERFALMKNPDGDIYNSRFEFWKNSYRIINDFTLTGTGLGSFIHVYWPYKTLVNNLVVNHAHNDYIQLLVEGGAIGFAVIAVFMAVLFVKTFRAFLRRRDAFCVYLYMGSLTGMVAILFHSVTDFNLQIGANGLWFAFLAGLLVSSAHTNIRRKNSRTRLALVRGRVRTSAFIGISLVFVAALAVFQVSHLGGSFYMDHIRENSITADTTPAQLEAITSIARTASDFDPLLSGSRYFQAVAAVRKEDIDGAWAHFRSAICLAPLNSWYLRRFGRFAALENQPQKAETAFALAAQYRPTRPIYAFQYGTWLLSNGQIDKGIEMLRTTLELDDKYSDKVLRTLLSAGVDRQQMKAAIPRTPGPMFAYADFLYTTGRRQQGEKMYHDILDLLEHQTKPKSRYYTRAYRFFLRQKNLKDATAAIELGERLMPDNPSFKVIMGDLYQRQGILFKAREKYEQALYINPNHRSARQRIQKLDAKK